MKLAVFGAATVILGLALGVDGLALAGLVWICCGIAVRLLQGHYRAAATTVGAPEVEADPAAGKQPPYTVPVWVSTLVYLAIGVPSLLIGLLEVGFDEADLAWRWLPIAIGGLFLLLIVVPGLIYLLGTGAGAVAEMADAAAEPEPVPGLADDGDDPRERLERLEGLRRDGLVTEAEYAAQRERILGSL